MKTATFFGTLAILMTAGIAQAASLSVTQNVGETALSRQLLSSSQISAEKMNDGLSLNLSSQGSASGYGATDGLTEEEHGCGKRITAQMNTVREEIFFVFDDNSARAINPLCPKSSVGKSRMTITVLEKETGNVSATVLQGK